jgi:hypothetical protein
MPGCGSKRRNEQADERGDASLAASISAIDNFGRAATANSRNQDRRNSRRQYRCRQRLSKRPNRYQTYTSDAGNSANRTRIMKDIYRVPN